MAIFTIYFRVISYSKILYEINITRLEIVCQIFKESGLNISDKIRLKIN